MPVPDGPVPKTFNKLSVAQLAEWVHKANVAFHTGEPIMTDDFYDAMKNLLEKKDPANPVLHEVGAALGSADEVATIEERVKVALPFWMGSQDKIKADAGVLKRFVEKHPGDYVVTDKLDGISGLLHWKNGRLALYTRGDGVIGQDISHVIPYIRGIPPVDAAAAAAATDPEYAVRLELIIPRVDWHDDMGSNARNVVAGAIGAKTLNVAILRVIEAVAYEWLMPDRLSIADQLAKLAAMGFTTTYSKRLTEADMTVDALSELLVTRRSKSRYVIDGLVVVHNVPHNRNTSGNPKYAFAFKSLITQDRAEVLVTHVEWNISKDLKAKPLVHFNEVTLSGVRIKQATGFNAAYIESNVIGPGSRIIVTRAGDVIPHILEVLTPSGNGEPSMPEFPYVWNATHVDVLVDTALIRQGDGVSDEIAIREMVHFFDKVDVPGVSEGILKKLYAAGHKTISSVIDITVEQLLRVEGVKQKSADKIARAIRDAIAGLTPLKLMVASNAFGQGFGERKIRLILEHVPAVLSVGRYTPTVEELVAIPSIEKKTADAFIAGTHQFWKFVEENRLERVMVSPSAKVALAQQAPMHAQQAPMQAPQAQQAPHPAISGKAFVFTGFRDKDMEASIEAAGGRVSDGISKKTDFLVIKEVNLGKKSGKEIKAEELGVKIITKAELAAML